MEITPTKFLGGFQRSGILSQGPLKILSWSSLSQGVMAIHITILYNSCHHKPFSGFSSPCSEVVFLLVYSGFLLNIWRVYIVMKPSVKSLTPSHCNYSFGLFALRHKPRSDGSRSGKKKWGSQNHIKAFLLHSRVPEEIRDMLGHP